MRNITTSAALAACLAVAATAPAAAQQNLVYGSWVPATDWLNAGALPETFRRITEATGGEITWELVPGGQLAGGVETFAAVKDGLMDAGVAVPTYVPDLTPAMSMLYSTVVPGSDPVAAAGASVETVLLNCPSCLAEAREQNAIPLGGYAGAPFYLMCTQPVTSVADIAGKRVRASGASLGILNQAGAQVISASLTEAVSLLQRGGLDCVAGVSGWLKTFGYGEFAKHVTDFPLGVSSPVLALWINRDVFTGLTREQQIEHLRGAAYLSATQTIDLFIKQNAANVAEAQANFGVEFVPVGDDFAQLMAAYQAEERGINVGKAEEFGVADAGAVYDAYAANLEKWRGLSAEIGDDVEKFAQVLWDEVYSKVNPDDL